MGRPEDPDLSAQELEQVDAIVGRLTSKAKRHPTVLTLIDQWRRAVQSVEAGYPGNVDDYAYDLTNRDLLQNVLDATPEAVRRKIAHALGPIDARFLAVTRPDPSDVLGKFYGHGNQWWWARLPKVIQGPLAATLRPYVQ